MSTLTVGRQKLNPWNLVVPAIVVVLVVMFSFTPLFRQEISAILQSAANIQAPAWLAFMERASYPITYLIWAVAVLAVIASGFIIRSRGWYGFMELLGRYGITASTERIDIRKGIRLGAEMAGLAAFCWIVLSPIPIIPKAVHFRIFAFVPGLVAVIFGAGDGFVAGYLGSVAWALMAGYWIPSHTPVADGLFVGLFTGAFVSWVLRGKRSRTELLEYIQAHRLAWYVKSILVNLTGGMIMAFFVAASLQVSTAGGVPWWMGFFTIGVLSDTLPMALVTPFLVEPLLILTHRRTDLPNW